MRYTVDDVMKWNPCYKRAKVKKLFGRRRSVTLVDMLSSGELSDHDAIWCACRAMDDRQRRLFACDCAESVVHLATDPRVAECIAVARRYVDGLATGEELRAARAAARAAAYAYAAAAARAAADAADAAYAYAAAADAAYAARAAAADAARAAAADAARAAAADAAYADTAYAAYADTAYAAYAAYADTAYAAGRETQRNALLMLALAGEIQ